MPLVDVRHGALYPLPIARLVLVHRGDTRGTAFKVDRLTLRYAEWGEAQAQEPSLASQAPGEKDHVTCPGKDIKRWRRVSGGSCRIRHPPMTAVVLHALREVRLDAACERHGESLVSAALRGSVRIVVAPAVLYEALRTPTRGCERIGQRTQPPALDPAHD